MHQDENYSSIEIDIHDWFTLCRLRPEVFAHFYFSHIIRVKSGRFHFDLYKLFEKLIRTPESCYFAVAAPRGNAKTQILSVILPLWCVIFELKSFIVLISETTSLAISNLDSIKHELMFNELLARDFPYAVGQGPRWTKDEITTANGVKIVALGSGKQVRGRVHRGGIRPDLILLDDILSDKFVRTKTQRDYMEEWFTKAVLGMEGAGKSGSKTDVFVLGTILHPHDLLSKLLDPTKYPGWETYKYKAVESFSTSPLWKTWENIFSNPDNPNAKNDAYAFFKKHEKEMLEGTKVLWPEGDPYYDLMVYKLTHGIRAFYSEKQNEPLDPSSTLFDTSKIRFYDPKVIQDMDLDFYAGIDFASGDAKKKGDMSVIVTIGKNRKTGVMYVMDVFAEEATPTRTVDVLKILDQKYVYKRVAIDQDAIKMMKEYIQTQIPTLRLFTYDLRIKKNLRLERLEPLVSNGILQFRRNQYDLLEQLECYPKVEHDDILDALEMATRIAGQRGFRLLTY